MTEIYVSSDVETDGPIPGPYSMLSFASAAYLSDKTLLDTFSANLEPLPGASSHPPHTHRALDDAIEQGAVFCNMLVESRTE